MLSRGELSREDLRLELKEYERHYGVPSSRLVEVFRTADGTRVVETPAFLDWTFLYSIYRRMDGPKYSPR